MSSRGIGYTSIPGYSGRTLCFQQDPDDEVPADGRGGGRCRHARRPPPPGYGGTGAAQPQASARAGLTQQQINEEMLKELRAIRLLLERLTTPQGQPPPQPQTAKVTNLKGYAHGPPGRAADDGRVHRSAVPVLPPVHAHVVRRDQEELDRHRQAALHQPRLPARLPRAGDARGARRALRRRAGQVLGDAARPHAERQPADARVHQEDRERTSSSRRRRSRTCAASTKYDAEIQAETREGTALGVGGTPTFVMGRTTATAVEGPMMVGALPYFAVRPEAEEPARRRIPSNEFDARRYSEMKKVVLTLGVLALTSGMAYAQDVNDPEPTRPGSPGRRDGGAQRARKGAHREREQGRRRADEEGQGRLRRARHRPKGWSADATGFMKTSEYLRRAGSARHQELQDQRREGRLGRPEHGDRRLQVDGIGHVRRPAVPRHRLRLDGLDEEGRQVGRRLPPGNRSRQEMTHGSWLKAHVGLSQPEP